MLEEHRKLFARLRIDRNRNHYPAATNYAAPHKAFLLLSIMDLVAQGQITSNFIEPSFDLVDTWNGYWTAIMPEDRRGLMSYPFYHMRSEPFWRLVPNPGFEDRAGQTFSSMLKIRQVYAGAFLDKGLFACLADPAGRELLRSLLVETYFAPEIQPAVQDLGFVNLAVFAYARDVMAEAKESLESYAAAPPDGQKIRSQGFRKAIVTLYNHRCALCGIRMLTAEGHTVVEAAHIVPWSETQDDLPTNGLCLCRLCHWSFDEGLMSVGKAYEVLVSDRVRTDLNIPGHVLTLQDRPIFKPDEDLHWPGQENLKIHRQKCFN